MTDKKPRKNRVIDAITAVVLCIAVFAVAVVISDIEAADFLLFGKKPFNREEDFVRIIDVGQGDSILVYSNGYSALIDTGIEDSSAEVLKTLEDCGIKTLDVLLLTHLDSDHIGGAEDITDVYGVGNLILPEMAPESEGVISAKAVMDKVKKSGGSVYTAVQGMNFNIGEFELTVLAVYPELKSTNNRSIVTAARLGDKRFLFTGDIEATAEERLLGEGLDLKCDVLKVAHHGSSTSSDEELLKRISPRFAAISVGQDNEYAHPHNEVLNLLEYIGAEIYRTDLDGDISFYVENEEIKIKTEK